MLLKFPVCSHVFKLFWLLAGLLILTPAAHAKNSWASGLDLEPSLRAAALVMAVRVADVSQVRIVYGGKGSETLYQYTFEPIRILKGVYSRPRLLMTNADLRSYSTSFDPKDIQSGQQRLLLLGRSSVGYIGIHSGATADLAFPRLEGKTDPLLGAAEALLAQQELLDRFEIVSRLARHLRDAEGRGAMVLLAALDRRPYIAAQQDLAIKAINQQLTADEVLVREAAAHVMGNLLRADYLNNHVNREAAVAGLVASLNHPDTSLAARVAALQGLGSAVDAVRSNPAAVRLVGLDTPYETLAELSARLDILGALHENSGIDPSAAVSGLLTNLPLDAPAHVQLAATKSWARLATANGADRLLDRLRRKKALGLEGAAEVEAFGLILPKTSTPWQLQSTLLEIGLTTSEQEAFVQACEHTPSPQLVSALSDMLDPRHRRLSRLAANLLMEIDTKAAARALRAHMPEEADLAYKLHLAAFLGTHGFDDGYPFALEHMSDPRYLEAAVEALATINSSGTSDELLEIYGTSNDLGWKRAAVRTLGLLGHKAFQDELLNLTRDLDHPLAPSALQARADMGDVAVIGLLPTALSSHNQGIAVAGARAAARVLSQQRGGGNPAATDVRKALGTLARDPGAVQAVRHLALEALVTADDPQLHDVLIVMVRDFQLERSTLMTRVRELLRDRKVRM